ncbi:putative branched-chain-amino-acid aminotransferase [Diplocarpon rosae]|nr:putative branched-chain-amino-acid aminotransferase [Diplocarpon rosae]
MAPSAIAPPREVQQVKELNSAAVARTISETAPELVNKHVAEGGLRPLDASQLKFTRTTTPMSVPAPGDPIIATASQCTDHMLTAVWKSGEGWADPELRPYGDLPLAPTASCLHYATQCFEGMKFYRGFDAGALGVATPKEATLFVIATFMPPMSQEGGLKLLASTDGVRAWPGGFGYAKVGANYGPSLLATGEARTRGYDQVLWLLDGKVTEAGASNFFVVWKTSGGRLQLVTAPLDDKIILDGITRRSILQLARERLVDGKSGLGAIEIVERNFTMDDMSWLFNIMYGKETHEWGVVVEEEEEQS